MRMRNHKTLGQMRGSGISEADRYRITVELCQNIFNWLDEEKDPIGQVGTSKVVLIGAHARLSNIDDQGFFIEDELFVYQGKETHRKAQTSAKGLMKKMVQLRRDSAQVRKYLEVIEVYQQPSGFLTSSFTLG